MRQSKRTPCPDCGRKYIWRYAAGPYSTGRRLVTNCHQCHRCEKCAPSDTYQHNWLCDDCVGPQEPSHVTNALLDARTASGHVDHPYP